MKEWGWGAGIVVSMFYESDFFPGFAGAERCLRVSQGTLSIFYDRMRAA